MRKPNKAYWTGTEVTSYDRKQHLIITRKDEVLSTIVDLIPFDAKQEFCVVDIGAGQGDLSEQILQRFEHANVVLFDASKDMLSVAEERLSKYHPRFSVVVGDFNDADWNKPIRCSVQAVVSSIALQYLRMECRKPFFEGIYGLLQKPGYFANGGSFDTEHDFIQQYYFDKRLEYTQKQLRELENREVSLETLRQKRQAEEDKAGVNRLTLREQIGLLEHAGFEHVEIVWRYLSFAVVIAYNSGPP